jgi:heme oxygenase
VPVVTYSPGMSVQTQVARSEAWRAGSRAEHEAAESSAFVAELVAGRASAAQYVAYLRRLRVVYAELEAALEDHRDHPVVAAVHDPALRRLPALDADLRHWSGSVAPVAGSPAADAYRTSIRRARREPHLLVAHHYTRYLGDLSGGRILARALRLGFPDRSLEDGGLDFYAFVEIPAPVRWKRGYRERLDALELDPEADRAMLAEVREAFRLNHALLDEVALVDQTRDRARDRAQD